MRQLITILSVCMVLVSGGTAVSTAAQVTILVNPGPFASVEEAARSEEKVNWWDADLSDDRACTECFAALELAHFLTVCTSLSQSDIVLCSPDKLPAKGDVFLVGSRQSNSLIASRDLPEDTKLNTDESFRLKADQENNRTITIIEGKDRAGTLYGVYGYLEQLGIRFYGLGEKGTVYPSKLPELPRTLNVIENPSFLTRGFWAWEDRGNEEFFLWMARNRMNLWTAAEKEVHFLKKLGLKLTEGHHDIQIQFLDPGAEYPYNHPQFKGDESRPKDPYALGDEYTGDTNSDGKLTYFEAHPEWYRLRDGKRSDRITECHGDNYCTSNMDATKELAKNMVQCLIDGCWQYVDGVDFWMSDSGKWCECNNCKRQGTYTDRLFGVVHTVLMEIRNARSEGRLQRNVQLSTHAYGETISAPTRPLPDDFDYENFYITFFPGTRCYAHSFADPACTEVNQHLLKHYQGWTMGPGRFYTGSICIGEYYNVSGIMSLPVLFTRIMSADIPWYYRTGARHFNYMHVPTRLWGTWTLNQYLFAQLLWDTETNVEALLDDYFRKYYPTTSEHTRNFYHHLETALANIKSFKHVTRFGFLRERLIKETTEMFPMEHLRYDSYHPVLNDGPDIVDTVEAMRLARKEIDAALMQCADKKEQARLIEDERRFAYGEAMVFFYYHLVRTAIFHRRGDEVMARHEFAYVEWFAEKLQGITDLVQVFYQVHCHVNSAKNGLEATQAVDVYTFFKERYGN